MIESKYIFIKRQ